MKKLLLGLLCGFALSGQAFAQSAIIRGEVSPGVYENIKSDGFGNLSVATNISNIVYVQTNVTVTTTAANAIAANANRRFLLVQNKDVSGTIYLNFATTATAANGISIGPGQTFILDTKVPTGGVSAIGSIASNTNILFVQGQ